MIVIGIALLLAFMGFGIKKYKWYFLIAGYNTMSEDEKENVEVEKIAKDIAIMTYIVAGLIIITYILGPMFPQVEYLLMIGIPVVAVGTIVKVQRYDQNKKNKAELWGVLVVVAVPVIIIGIVMATSLKPVKIDVNSNELKINNLTIERNEIESVNLIEEYPKASKIIGFNMAYNRNGTFEVDGVGRCYLYTDSGKTPLLEVKANGETYVFNSKENGKIQEVYDELK